MERRLNGIVLSLKSGRPRFDPSFIFFFSSAQKKPSFFFSAVAAVVETSAQKGRNPPSPLSLSAQILSFLPSKLFARTFSPLLLAFPSLSPHRKRRNLGLHLASVPLNSGGAGGGVGALRIGPRLVLALQKGLLFSLLSLPLSPPLLRIRKEKKVELVLIHNLDQNLNSASSPKTPPQALSLMLLLLLSFEAPTVASALSLPLQSFEYQNSCDHDRRRRLKRKTRAINLRGSSASLQVSKRLIIARDPPFVPYSTQSQGVVTSLPSDCSVLEFKSHLEECGSST